MVSSVIKQACATFFCTVLLSMVSPHAQASSHYQKNSKKIPLNKSRSTLFGNAGFASQVQFSNLFSSGFQTGTTAGAGLSLEQPFNRHFVMGVYMSGAYLSTKAYEITVEQQSTDSATVTLTEGGRKGSGLLEGGGLMKIRFPFNNHVAWYFPIGGGVGGLFVHSGTQFMGAFHISLVGVEALLSEHLGITFNTMSSIHKAKGPMMISNTIQLGLVVAW
ncbi:MAG: hypothetical protein AAF320_05135 [Myxococcota bacterium]